MDKRLFLEILPGPAFLVGHGIGGLFLGALFGTIATALAIVLRWRWDRRLPLMALFIFAMTVVFVALGFVFDEASYIKISNTIGSLIFAAFLAGGALLRPSLLSCTLGYTIHLTEAGWRVLHGVWIGLSLARGAANEIIWRLSSDAIWATYNGVSDIAWIGVFYLATSRVAHRYWQDPT